MPSRGPQSHDSRGRRSLLLPIVLLAALLFGLVAACDDDDDDPSDASEGSTATATGEATTERTTTPTPSTTTTATPTGTLAPTATATTTSSAGTGSATVVSPYERFAYSVFIEIGNASTEESILEGTVSGTFVAPDRHQLRNDVSVGPLAFSDDSIVIGEDAWTREGTEPFERTSLASLAFAGTSDLSTLDPEFFGFDEEFVQDFDAFRGTPELRAGVETERIELDEILDLASGVLDDEFLGFDAALLALFNGTAWIDREAGALVAFDLSFEGDPRLLGDAGFDLPTDGDVRFSMRFALTDINDPSIQITPPTE